MSTNPTQEIADRAKLKFSLQSTGVYLTCMFLGVASHNFGVPVIVATVGVFVLMKLNIRDVKRALFDLANYSNVE